MDSNSFITKGEGDQPLPYNSTVDESILNEVSSENNELTPKLSRELNDSDDSPKRKKKKRSLLDDDFFSLAGSFEKRKKKHKHKHKQKEKEKGIDVQDQVIENDGLIEVPIPQLTKVSTDKEISSELASSQSDIPRKNINTVQPEISTAISIYYSTVGR